MSGWRQLAVTLDAADAASATALLEAAGAASVTTSAADDEELFVAHAGEVSDEAPLWSRCRVTGLFPEDQDLSAVRQQFAALRAVELHETHLDDDAWQLPAPEISLQFGGDRLRLRPRSAAGGTAEVPTLYLDAGLAFGSGSHPTTRMCLEFLATAPLRGARVLDYGCGSGILAIAAALLGARSVVGVDIDPQSWFATRQNALYNSVPESLLAVMSTEQFADEADASEPFDLVVANILANPLIELAPRLCAALAPGGTLTLTGVLASQASAVADAYAGGVVLREADRETLDGASWIRLEGQRAPA